MEVIAIALGVITGVTLLVLLWKPMFGDADGFWECIRFWLTPDIVSLFRGNYGRDYMAELKLGFWLFAGGGGGFVIYLVVSALGGKAG